jgi:Flp pilus assembly protein TadB
MNAGTLVLAGAAAALVLWAPWALRPPLRIRTLAGPRRLTRPWSGRPAAPGRAWGGRFSAALLPWPLRLIRQILLLDARGPAAGRLRWRLIHAGQHHSPAWVRGRQALVAGILVAVVVAGSWAGLVPSIATVPLVAGACVAGITLPLADLSWRARARREQMRYELVPLLHALAALAAAGLTLEQGLHEAAAGEGVLAAELRRALELRSTGVGLDEALRVLAERCATPEVTAALRRIVAARRGGIGRVSPALRELAASTRRRLRQQRRERKARALLGTTALLALLGLPPILGAVLYPVVVLALHGGY